MSDSKMQRSQTINLFLWRHAEAEDRFPDLARALTDKGRRDASRVARSLSKQLDGNTRLISSPAVRARETVAPLVRKSSLPIEIDDRLAPGADSKEVLRALGDAIEGCTGESPSLVLVGHQPWVGQVARRLLTDDDGEWSVKKAAVWWLVRRSRDGSTEWVLRSIIDPELL